MTEIKKKVEITERLEILLMKSFEEPHPIKAARPKDRSFMGRRTVGISPTIMETRLSWREEDELHKVTVGEWRSGWRSFYGSYQGR